VLFDVESDSSFMVVDVARWSDSLMLKHYSS
jgi:hypothetical protein